MPDDLPLSAFYAGGDIVTSPLQGLNNLFDD